MIPWLGPRDPFPPVEVALSDPNGLLAAGADLSVPRLLDAYRQGIFPWYSEGDPLLWWSPDPRMVLFLDELRVTRSLRRVIQSKRFSVTLDRAFLDVMAGCAAPRDGQDGTWINDEMINAYSELHKMGYAHSAEAWLDGELAGGLYGIRIGNMFFGESMFSLVSNASKFAFISWVQYLQNNGVQLVDCQVYTGHLESLGAKMISRESFVRYLQNLVPR